MENLSLAESSAANERAAAARRASRRRVPSLVNPLGENWSLDEVIRMLIAVLAAFVICWGPKLSLDLRVAWTRGRAEGAAADCADCAVANLSLSTAAISVDNIRPYANALMLLHATLKFATLSLTDEQRSI